MNSLKIAHTLGQLIARRKTGETGEFDYVCLRSGEERSGRREIIELVKERNKEGWRDMKKHVGEGESDKDFEAKVRKLVAKLPWEKKAALSTIAKIKQEEYYENLKIEDERDVFVANLPCEKKEDLLTIDKVKKEEYYENLKLEDEIDDNIDDTKDEVKETVKLQGIRLCNSMKVEDLKEETNACVSSDPSYQRTKKIFEKFRLRAVEKKCWTFRIQFERGHYQSWCSVLQANFGSPEDEGVHGLRFTAKDTCLEKDNPVSVFLTLKKKSHKLLIQADPLHIIHLMENHFENLHNQVYAKCSLDVRQQPWLKREKNEPEDKVKSEVDNEVDKTHNPDGKLADSMSFQFACLSETCDKTFLKWKVCKKHILVCCGIVSTKENNKEMANRSSHAAKMKGTQYRNCGNSMMEKLDDSAMKYILSRLCEMFYRTVNSYHCRLCNNKWIGGTNQKARDHLAISHSKDDLEMKQFIKEKYDQFAHADYEAFLKLVLHKVEMF